MDISEFHQSFFDEADELLDEMEHVLVALDPAAPDAEQLNAVFRSVHSIKGGAGAFGFTMLQETAHLLEGLLDRARTGQIVLDPSTVDALLKARDSLTGQLHAYRNGSTPDMRACEHLCSMLRALAEQPAVTAATAQPTSAGSAAQPTTPAVMATEQAGPGRLLSVTIRDIAETEYRTLTAELALLGEITSQAYARGVLTVQLISTENERDIEAVLCFVVDAEQVNITRQDQPQAAPASVEQTSRVPAGSTGAPAAAKRPDSTDPSVPVAQLHSESSTLRVATAKIDQIINLVGELVITQSMLEQTAARLNAEACTALAEGVDQLQRNTRDLQEAIMSVRMVPMDYAFSRFPRLVRDLSARLGKQVALSTQGASTELDKGMIEHIMDPLTHLVRNSVDHGIETPEQRLAAGKAAAGMLMLAARHQGGDICIQISDDGAGLDREHILARAADNGLTVPDGLSDEAVWPLIFAPGLSTADTVTNVSGRGVGMDVVKRNIEELGGHVDIQSTTGKGTTTSIVLPLTLAIMDGMSVRVGDEVFIVPLGAIMESMRVSDDQINTVTGNERLLHVRGHYLSLIELRRVFDVPGVTSDLEQGIVMVLQSDGRRFAVLVDHLLGQHQVVVKNLETNYRKVEGISAATILGDGSVALILDVAALSRLGQHRQWSPARQSIAEQRSLRGEVMS